jgi:hypothetical protein
MTGRARFVDQFAEQIPHLVVVRDFWRLIRFGLEDEDQPAVEINLLRLQCQHLHLS